MTKLYNDNQAALLLGCLCHNPSLTCSDRYNLKKEDFTPNRFHRILFASIKNLYLKGVQEITEVDVLEFIKNYPNQETVLLESDVGGFIETTKKLCNLENIDCYVSILKKYALLRECSEQGIDISEIVDVETDSEAQNRQLDQWELDDIIKHFEGKLSSIKKNFYCDKSIEEYKLGMDLLEVVEGFKQEPMFGYSTFSKYLNTASRGLIKGQLTCYSIPSGGGKSCIGSAALANICCDELFDIKTHSWVKNSAYCGESGLYIQYEMDSKTELSPRILAAVSKVGAKDIMDGHYEYDEEERVRHAIEVVDRSNLYVVTMPQFTMQEIDNYVKDYVLTKNVGFVVFDYISEQSSVNSELARKNKVQTRSDQTLANMASELKEMARKYNIAILTFTQCNANIENAKVLDANCIAGSRAVANKLDVGCIITGLRGDEKSIAEMYVNEKDCNGLTPNRVIHVYKVRFGAEEQNIKIYGYMNLSTGEWVDMFVTNKNDEPYQMQKTVLKGLTN